MSQTEPAKLSLASLEQIISDKCPTRLPLFTAAKEALDDPAATTLDRCHKLTELVSRPVEHSQQSGLDMYTWQGSKPFVLTVPRPFQPQRSPVADDFTDLLEHEEPQEPAAGEADAAPEVVEPEVEEPEVVEPEAEEPDAQPEPREVKATPQVEPDAAPTSSQEPEPDQQQKPEPPTAPQQGGGTRMFTALAALLGDTTLLMTIAKQGEQQGEPLLIVTVLPKAEDSPIQPICLTATASELDQHFHTAITTKATSAKSLQAAIEEEKAADKALTDAKTKAAEEKRKAAQKTTAAKRQETETKPKETPASPPEPQPAEPKPQPALF